MRLVTELKKHKRVIIFSAYVALGVFVFLNIITWAFYHGKTYPNTTVAGQEVGSQQISNLNKNLSQMPLLPKKVTLTYNQAKVEITPADLGLQLNTQATVTAVSKRSWIPLFNLINPPETTLQITTDKTKLQKTIKSFSDQHQKAPVNARPTVKDGVFQLTHAANGNTVDITKAQTTVVTAISAGKVTIALPAKTVKPSIDDAKAMTALTLLQSQQKTPLTYSYQGKTTKPTASDFAGFYADANDGYTLSEDNIQAYIVKVGSANGIRVQNLSVAVSGTMQAIQKNKAYSIELVAIPKASRTFTYCTAVRGVDANNLPTLEAKLAAVYGDSRGWGLDGQIKYVKATSGCNFTVWLSAADQMPSFGTICDSTWSCTVSPNVILNYDRWTGASSAWNNAGGNLDDYRSMVINHETGHWLGFGHKFCSGPGQAAPVMQQQSIDLQGCSFNPWPLASEQTQLKTYLGL